MIHRNNCQNKLQADVEIHKMEWLFGVEPKKSEYDNNWMFYALKLSYNF